MTKSPALSQRTREGQGTRLLFMGKAWASPGKPGPAPRTEQRSPQLDAGYVVALLVVLFIGFGLVVHLARAAKSRNQHAARPDCSKRTEKRLEGRRNRRVRARGRSSSVRALGGGGTPFLRPIQSSRMAKFSVLRFAMAFGNPN